MYAVQCCSPHPGFQLKTPKKVLVVKKTPSKKSYNLEESLRKKPAYKPYTGIVHTHTENKIIIICMTLYM